MSASNSTAKSFGRRRGVMQAAFSGTSTEGGLHGFLRESRARVLDQHPSGLIHVVLGNEAGDADSIVSAIALAYFNHLTHEACGPVSIPVISIPRRDLRLRPETSILLNRAKVDVRDLVFFDELNLHTLHESDQLRLTLVDHNALAGSLSDLAKAVDCIVDHHQDQGLYEWVTGGRRLIAFDSAADLDSPTATVASTCTIITEKYLATAAYALDSTLMTLLLGVILIDSSNLDPKAHKATARDHSAAQALEERLKAATKAREATQDHRQDLFKVLSEAKFDQEWWALLSVDDALRLDYKQFTAGEAMYGMSSVLVPVAALVDRKEFASAAEAFCKERGLDVLIILSFTLPPHRQVAVFASHGPRAQAMASLVESMEAEGSLGLMKVRSGGGVWVFEQGTVGASRKQIEPLVRRLLEASAG